MVQPFHIPKLYRLERCPENMHSYRAPLKLIDVIFYFQNISIVSVHVKNNKYKLKRPENLMFWRFAASRHCQDFS